MRRFFFDVSYTRTQTGSVGITRTVRRLLEEFQAASSPATDRICVPVIFHSSGFREAAADSKTATNSGKGTSSAGASLGVRLLNWVTSSRVRSFVSTKLPLPILHVAWLAYNSWIFDKLSQQAQPVTFQKGDYLLLCDASWNYQVWLAASTARQHGAHVVLMVHDLIPLRHPEFCVPLFSLVFRKWLLKMLQCSDAVVCNSAATEADLHAYAASHQLKLPPTSNFRLGCDLTRVANDSDVRQSLTGFVSGESPCFAAIGSIEPRKNYAWLLSVFEQLWTKDHRAKLLIVGRPTADCQELIQRLKQHPQQGGRLLTIFDASDAEIAHIYASCRALVFPSLAEGFGLPLVEARTRGCPVIANDLPVFRELADSGVSIFELNSEKALTRLVMEHAQTDHRMSVGPMPLFTWADSAQQFQEVIDKLVTLTLAPFECQRPKTDLG